MAVEKMGTTELRDQSPAADATTPSSRVSGALNMLHAYTLPMHRCVAMLAGGTHHRLKPSPATMWSFSSHLGIHELRVAGAVAASALLASFAPSPVVPASLPPSPGGGVAA